MAKVDLATATAQQKVAFPPTPAVSLDFTRQLPDFADPQAALEFINEICQQQLVGIAGMQVQPRPARRGQLQRTDINLKLRGRYANLKDSISKILRTTLGTTLIQLSMHRVAQQAELDASLGLALWAKPARSTAASDGVPVTSLAH